MLMPALKQLRRFSPALLVSSLLLNAVLGYCLLMPQPQPARESALPAAKPSVAKTPARLFAAPAPKPFQWSQLDAPDFPTYAKNLRAIGCPEATIRDILAGELDEVYRQQEAQSGRSRSQLNSHERARLQTERDQMLAQLTQVGADAAPAPVQTASSGAAGVKVQPVNGSAVTVGTTPVIPTAFAYGAVAGTAPTQGSPTVLTAAAGQSQMPPNTVASLQQMQSDFATTLGSTTQDPASEEYQEAWNLATRRSDERFSSMFGGDVFVRTQLDTARAAAAGAGAAKASQ